MNKKLIALLLLCSVIIFTGCASQESVELQPKIVTYAYQSEPVVFWDQVIHFQMKSL